MAAARRAALIALPVGGATRVWCTLTGPGRDPTPLPGLLHDTPRTGPVRTRRPVYADLLPPRNAG